MNCILENTSVLPSSNFVDFIHRASRICLGQSAKALVWRWRQISPLKINIFTLSAPISTNEVEEYHPFGTLSNMDTFDYTAKLRYGQGLGLVSRKKRAKTVW